MISRRLSTAALVWAALAAVPLAANIDSIQVTPVVAEGRVSTSFVAPAAFDADVQELIQSGLLVTLTFTVELRRPSAVWFDRTIASVTVASTVKFDNLTGVYHVSKHEAGRVVWSDRTQDAALVKNWLTTFELVPLATAETLEPNAEYYVHVSLQTTPKRTFTLWPWPGGSASGRAGFTFIR